MMMRRMKLKLNVSVKCNTKPFTLYTKPFAEPQFEVNQEKGFSLHIAIYVTV